MNAAPSADLVYRYAPPKFYREQVVNFHLHNGAVRRGTVRMIRTYYRANHDAYHIYTMRPEGWVRDVHVGEKNLIEVTK